MSDTNQHKGTAHAGTEPRFFNEGTDKPPFAKLFAIMNESFVDRAGVKHEAAIPVNILLPRKIDVEKAHDVHTGTAISWTGKVAHRVYEVAGEKRTSFEIVVAGPGAKFDLVEPQEKGVGDGARAAIGRREQQATAPAHIQ